MNILALDLATRTGWATLTKDGQRFSGVQTFDVRRGESPGMRFLRLHRWLVDLPRPELLVYEAAHHRGGHATAVGVGFSSHVLSFCAQYGIEHQPVHTATLKKFTTGNGRAGKDEMVAAVVKRWRKDVSTLDDNEADAIALLEYAVAEFVPVGSGRANARYDPEAKP